MLVNKQQLKAIFPHATGKNIELFCQPINDALAEFGMTHPTVVAMFLAQIGHESGELRYVKELASGAAYDTGRLAARLGNTPEADGDGQRYKGRGLIQITGVFNYKACSLALFNSEWILLKNPELLEQPIHAVRSACWFWESRNLSKYAHDIKRVTKLINGGYNGLKHREELFARAKKVLGSQAAAPTIAQTVPTAGVLTEKEKNEVAAIPEPIKVEPIVEAQPGSAKPGNQPQAAAQGSPTHEDQVVRLQGDEPKRSNPVDGGVLQAILSFFFRKNQGH